MGSLSQAEIASVFHLTDDLAARFPLDEGAGLTSADVVGNRTATASASVKWGQGVSGSCAVLNGTDGLLSTPGPVLHTDASFTVAAWVKLDRAASPGAYTAVSQDGAQVSGFYLQAITPAGQTGPRWALGRLSADSTGATPTWASSAEPVAVGQWTHLAGVYDAGTRQLRLYVDGDLAGTAPYAAGWDAAGALRIGGARWAGKPADLFPGAIDEVRLFQRALADGEVRLLS